MSDSCTVFSSILSPPGPLNRWQPMVTPADWEVQMETKLTSSFPESPFRKKCVWLNISTWPTTYDIELWEWPKKTWRGNCIAKKIKSESRLSSVPASFAESCPKFQSATPSHWNLWHALCLSTWALPWKLSETMQLELARAININLLTSPIFPDTMRGFGSPKTFELNLREAMVWLLQHRKKLTWCRYVSDSPPFIDQDLEGSTSLRFTLKVGNANAQ